MMLDSVRAVDAAEKSVFVASGKQRRLFWAG